MTVYTDEIHLSTKGEVQILDLRGDLEGVCSRSGVLTGILHCFVPGATGALSFIEYEPGLIEDFPAFLERVAPKGIDYAHHRTWDDGNGHSHVRATLLKPDISIPIREGRLVLGKWQHPILIELDVRPRDRTLLVTVTGE
jgi:secondary thiamine-phosphate synthase enzyme